MKAAKVYEKATGLEHMLSTAKSGNAWVKRGRGAVRWGPRDYVLWHNGEAIRLEGQLMPGGMTEAQAREWVASGKLPGKVAK